MRVRFLLGAHRARSSAVEQLPLKQLAEGSNPSALTISEIAKVEGAALAAPAIFNYRPRFALDKRYKSLYNGFRKVQICTLY